MKDSTVQPNNPLHRERIESLAAAYVLGALPESEPDYQDFERLLEANDPYLNEVLEQYFASSVLLADLAPQHDAPAFVKEQILSSASAYKQNGFSERLTQYDADKQALPLERKLRTKNRTIIGVSLISGIIICLLLAMNVSNSAKLDRSNDLMKALLHKTDSLQALSTGTTTNIPGTSTSVNTIGIDGALVGPVISMFQEGSGRKITLSTLTAPGHDLLYFSPKQHVVVVMRGELPPIDENHTYQLWSHKGSGAPQSVGTFRVDATSKQPMYAIATNLDAIDSFSLTVEPKGGSTTRTGPVIRTSHMSIAKRTM